MINRSLMLMPGSNISCNSQEEICRPVRTLIDPSLSNMEYGIKLSRFLSDLGMNQKELAAAIGTSEKTVARYLNGENTRPIKEDIKARINLALNEAMYYECYEHMPAEEFGDLFDKLWKEFESEISQEEFAVKAGHGNQSVVSRIRDGDYPVYSTKIQYDYLSVFYALCQRKAHYYFCDRPSKLAVFSCHHETAVMLHKLLFGSSSADNMFNDKKNNNGELSVNVVDTVIDYLISLPIEAQRLILSSPLAFLDSIATPNFHHSNGSYMSAREFIEQFRQLPKDEKLRFYNDLQKLTADEKVFNYSGDEREWLLFDMNTQYRSMISSARRRGITDPAGISLYSHTGDSVHDISVDSFRSKQDQNIDTEVQRHCFEEVISSFDDRCWKNCPAEIIMDTIIDDISYRLTMSPFEWHLWMLCASYVYTFHSDREIENLFRKSKTEQGLSVITDYIMSLPFDEQERIFLNPMFFFDSMALCSIGCNAESSVSYFKAPTFFSEYAALSYEEKQRFIETATEFRDMSSDFGGYPISCDYYDNYKEIPVYGNVQSQRKAIMQFLLDFPIYTSDEAATYRKLAELVIEDISYKMSMSQEQWDIWCLVIETVYNMSFCSSKAVSALEILHRIITAAKKG
ncbi:MAG: helix-turn-helix transcriptional regulator [Oscillospiraceae bacterium]|nr:helix-turn-helix transcriptional regulator [Oscillospiraceae bacterium]